MAREEVSFDGAPLRGVATQFDSLCLHLGLQSITRVILRVKFTSADSLQSQFFIKNINNLRISNLMYFSFTGRVFVDDCF